MFDRPLGDVGIEFQGMHKCKRHVRQPVCRPILQTCPREANGGFKHELHILHLGRIKVRQVLIELLRVLEKVSHVSGGGRTPAGEGFVKVALVLKDATKVLDLGRAPIPNRPAIGAGEAFVKVRVALILQDGSAQFVIGFKTTKVLSLQSFKAVVFFIARSSQRNTLFPVPVGT